MLALTIRDNISVAVRLPTLSYLTNDNCLLDVDLGESSHECHVLVPMQVDLPGLIASTSEDSMKSTSSQKVKFV